MLKFEGFKTTKKELFKGAEKAFPKKRLFQFDSPKDACKALSGNKELFKGYKKKKKNTWQR